MLAYLDPPNSQIYTEGFATSLGLTLLMWDMAGGLEVGIAAGIVMSTMNFAYSYAKVHVTAFTVVGSRSGRVRTFAERTMLELFYNRMAAVSLSGYIFFGSSVNISRQVHEVTTSLSVNQN